MTVSRISPTNTQRAGTNCRPSATNLYVACLPASLTNGDLLGIFRKWGAETATIMMDTQTGASRGYGFVTFPHEEDGHRALAALQNHPVVAPTGETFSMHITPSHFRASEPPGPSPFIFVRNIPALIPKEEVRRRVESITGPLRSIQFRDDFRSTGRMILMVQYPSTEAAAGAIELLNGRNVFQLPPDHPFYAMVMARFADRHAVQQFQRRRTSPLPTEEHLPPRRPRLVTYRHDPYSGLGKTVVQEVPL